MTEIFWFHAEHAVFWCVLHIYIYIIRKTHAHTYIYIYISEPNRRSTYRGTVAKEWLKLGCDIYLIGVEECSYTPRPEFSSCLEDWCDLVQASLPSLLIQCRHDMGHCQILFLATERVSKSIHNVVASHEETGLGGLYSNKGGLALSFWIGDNAICFVSSHLAAHQSNVSRRNLDSAHIIEGICLTTDSQRPLTNQWPGCSMAPPRGTLGGLTRWSKTLFQPRFQHVIWVGSLARERVSWVSCKHMDARRWFCMGNDKSKSPKVWCKRMQEKWVWRARLGSSLKMALQIRYLARFCGAISGLIFHLLSN